ncbi:MAG: hypothetical protein ACI4HI_09355 [Lachnospiraceae bacterium]
MINNSETKHKQNRNHTTVKYKITNHGQHLEVNYGLERSDKNHKKDHMSAAFAHHMHFGVKELPIVWYDFNDAGLVSMFSLETAMLTQFGKDDEAGFRQRMTTMTGTGVSLLVLGMAIWTLVRTTNLIRKEEKR